MAALVLAIEPDLRQATILKRIVRDRVKAEFSVVESPDAALAAIGIRTPDVLLLSALLSPRDEDELMGHLRSLDGADHIQTHTIPQLATTDADQEQGGRRGLLGVFKRKKETPQPIVSGCDPDLFAEEILTFIQRAAEKKAENIAALQSRADQLEYLVQSGVQPPTATTAAAPTSRDSEPSDEGQSASSDSAWASPFEWRKTPTAPAPSPPRSRARLPRPTSRTVSKPVRRAMNRRCRSSPRHTLRTRRAHTSTPTSRSPPRPIRRSMSRVPLSKRLRTWRPWRPSRLRQSPNHESRSSRDVRRHGLVHKNTTAPATLLRLTPLAMWARNEERETPPKPPAETPEPKTVAEELRNLMANLAVPPHVAGVSYGRGCRNPSRPCARRQGAASGRRARTGHPLEANAGTAA